MGATRVQVFSDRVNEIKRPLSPSLCLIKGFEIYVHCFMFSECAVSLSQYVSEYFIQYRRQTHPEVNAFFIVACPQPHRVTTLFLKRLVIEKCKVAGGEEFRVGRSHQTE